MKSLFFKPTEGAKPFTRELDEAAYTSMQKSHDAHQEKIATSLEEAKAAVKAVYDCLERNQQKLNELTLQYPKNPPKTIIRRIHRLESNIDVLQKRIKAERYDEQIEHRIKIFEAYKQECTQVEEDFYNSLHNS